jgi:hypothetical protein
MHGSSYLVVRNAWQNPGLNLLPLTLVDTRTSAIFTILPVVRKLLLVR